MKNQGRMRSCEVQENVGSFPLLVLTFQFKNLQWIRCLRKLGFNHFCSSTHFWLKISHLTLPGRLREFVIQKRACISGACPTWFSTIMKATVVAKQNLPRARQTQLSFKIILLNESGCLLGTKLCMVLRNIDLRSKYSTTWCRCIKYSNKNMLRFSTSHPTNNNNAET